MITGRKGNPEALRRAEIKKFLNLWWWLYKLQFPTGLFVFDLCYKVSNSHLMISISLGSSGFTTRLANITGETKWFHQRERAPIDSDSIQTKHSLGRHQSKMDFSKVPKLIFCRKLNIFRFCFPYQCGRG